MSTHLQIAGFNPIRGQSMNDYEFDEELGADPFTKMAHDILRKKLAAKFPEKSGLEIADMVNLAFHLQSWRKKGSESALQEMQRYWGRPTGTMKDYKGAPEYAAVVYTEQFLAGKRPWPGPPGSIKKTSGGGGGILGRAVASAMKKPRVMRGAVPGLRVKDAVMLMARHERAKKEQAKREAACPCKAREHAAKVRPIAFPPRVEAGLKNILGHLRFAAIQRKATSEHRGLSAQERFRRQVLDLLQSCNTRGERDEVVRVILTRG